MGKIAELLFAYQNCSDPIQKQTIKQQLQKALNEELQYYDDYVKRMQIVIEKIGHQHDPPTLTQYYRQIHY
jgi:hypothetical protein